MRGVAYSVRERELLMRLHQQGMSLSAISRQTGMRRKVLSRWWRRHQQEVGSGAAAPLAAAAVENQILDLRQRGWGPARISLALHKTATV